MLETTGYEFQGYFIKDYCGVIFDEILVGIGFFKSISSSIDNFFSAVTGSEATTMIEKLNAVKGELRKRMREKATRLGANALIGIDFESSKLGDMIMVSMTATAVRIEKIIEPLPYTEADEKAKQDRENAERAAKEEAQKVENMRKTLKEKGLDDAAEIRILLEEVKQCSHASQMYEKVMNSASMLPDVFSKEILAKLQNCVEYERVYGGKYGAKDFAGKLEQ